MGSSYGQHYISAAAMIVESAPIFSLFSLLFLALKHPLNLIFFQALGFVQIVTMLLIIFRVAQGNLKGWTTDSANPAISAQNGSMQRFASNSLATSLPVLESETNDPGGTQVDDRMIHFNDGSNNIGVNSREALEQAGSMQSRAFIISSTVREKSQRWCEDVV